SSPGICDVVLTVISVIVIVLTFPLSVWFCLKIVQEYERAVIFRLGRLLQGGAKGPGMIPRLDPNANGSTRLLAQTTLRNILGTKNLTEILSQRDEISQTMQSTLDEATDPWGVKVERIEVKDVRLPQQMQRAMAAEAEASRDARAKIIAAEGEMNASRSLKDASDILSESPQAIQLRYLQTLTTISAEKNSTIIFPLPIDMLSHFLPERKA
ncbi:predicted protein, partial [Nematostella vectensis]